MSPLLPSDQEALDYADGNLMMAIQPYRVRNGLFLDPPAYAWGLFLSGMHERGLLTASEVKAALACITNR